MATRGYHTHNTYVMVGEESTFGTSVSRSNTLKVKDCSGSDVTDLPDLDTLETSEGVATETYAGARTCRGSFMHPLRYENSGMVLKWAFGALADAGSDPYTHTYTLERDLGALTIENVRGNDAKSNVYEGCTCGQLELTQEANQPLMAKFDWVGEKGTSTNVGTPSTGSGQSLILYSQISSITWNGITLRARRYVLTLDNALDTSITELGTNEITQPTCGVRGVVCQVEVVANSTTADALFTGHHAATESNLVITYAGAGDHALVITAHAARITDPGDYDDQSSVGPKTYTITFRGRGDLTDHGLAAVMTNNVASGTAN